MSSALVRVGVDTGGTFTDLVAFDGREVRIAKILSTPENPARAVLQGLAQLVPDGRAIVLTYSTTVATNALLERRGARVLLFTTAGFEDVIEIGRQARPDLYALEPKSPPPLVARRDRIGIAERIAHDGEVLLSLTPATIRAAVREARRRKPAAVAVCFLHSYRRADHEQQLAAAMREAGFLCTASHELGARYREYERFSTAVINAYVAPKMGRHIGELAEQVRGGVFRVMQSNGGAMDATTAAREAARTILSGPAAGVVGAQQMAREARFSRLITFDMGGTSTDVCLVDGEIRRHAEGMIGGLPVQLPTIDVHTVGAGGGSLALRDAGGLLKVGPQSAGADPGPACYGRGDQPTVTDANLFLGRLGHGVLAGGTKLDGTRSEKALRKLARSLGLSIDAAALGVIRIANAAMERAIRKVSVERGHDPRDYVLVSFGGAAGLHACELADDLGIESVLVPRAPGVLSAWGAACAPVAREYMQTLRRVDAAFAELERVAAALARSARRDMRGEKIVAKQIRFESFAGLRYAGQSFEVEVPLKASYRAVFHREHLRLYGYRDVRRPVEVVYVGLRATAPQASGGASRLHRQLTPPTSTDRLTIRVRLEKGWSAARIVDRESLRSGASIAGPAILHELSATTWVPPRWRARVDRRGHLVLRHAR